jgi:hypothetical protein
MNLPTCADRRSLNAATEVGCGDVGTNDAHCEAHIADDGSDEAPAARLKPRGCPLIFARHVGASAGKGSG